MFTSKLPIILLGSMTAAFWIALLFTQTQITPLHLTDTSWFGDRRLSFFDLWTIQHILSGVIVGYVILNVKNLNLSRYVTLVLLTAVSWEIMELCMEYGLFGQPISNWKVGYEFIFNRLLIDPLSVLIGAVIFWHFKQTFYFALAPLIIWLAVNIASPNSMYIEYVLLDHLTK